ncbi:TolC family protein [bacterium]|nr:MAG: TolC family protein [bacterium]
MKMLTRRMIFLGFLILLLGVSRASAGAALTVEEAFRLALQANEQIQIAEQDLVQGKLLTKRAITVLMPRVTADASWEKLYYQDVPNSDFARWGLTWDQTLFASGRVWIARKGAFYTVAAAEYGLTYARETVLLNVLSAMYDILLAQKVIEIDLDRIERVKEQLRSAQARFDVGESPVTDILSAKVTLSNAELFLVESQKNLTLARRRLQDLIEAPVPENIFLPADVDIPELDIINLNNTAVKERSDLAQGRELIRISEQEAKLASAGRRPDIKLRATYDDYNEVVPFVPDATLGLTLSWPFLQGGQVSIDSKEAYSRVRQVEEGYSLQVKEALYEVEEAVRKLEALEAQKALVEASLENARENFRLQRLRFDLGDGTSLDTLAAQLTLTEAENLDATHKYQTRLARAGLLYFIGKLKPDVFGMSYETGGESQ